jgi:UDPglucose 6-dehydrogenase
VLCTEWEELRALDLDRARAIMAFPILLDARNAFSREAASLAGFTYLALGRPSALAAVQG